MASGLCIHPSSCLSNIDLSHILSRLGPLIQVCPFQRKSPPVPSSSSARMHLHSRLNQEEEDGHRRAGAKLDGTPALLIPCATRVSSMQRCLVPPNLVYHSPDSHTLSLIRGCVPEEIVYNGESHAASHTEPPLVSSSSSLIPLANVTDKESSAPANRHSISHTYPSR